MSSDISSSAKTAIFILILSVIFVCGFGVYTALGNSANVKEYQSQLQECNEDGYVFYVDGVKFVKLSDEFIASSHGKYNVAVDDVGRQVVLTSITERVVRDTNLLPIILH